MASFVCHTASGGHGARPAALAPGRVLAPSAAACIGSKRQRADEHAAGLGNEAGGRVRGGSAAGAHEASVPQGSGIAPPYDPTYGSAPPPPLAASTGVEVMQAEIVPHVAQQEHDAALAEASGLPGEPHSLAGRLPPLAALPARRPRPWHLAPADCPAYCRPPACASQRW
jgi:hypothetical protein